jgi:hypothetical protein
MAPDGEFLTRAEFNQFQKSINGSLERIEDKLDIACGQLPEKVSYEAFDRHKQEASCSFDRVYEKLAARPSWPVATLLAFFSTTTFTLLGLFLSQVI